MRVVQRPGPVNTNEVISHSKEAASRYTSIVVASITGDSAIKVAEAIQDKNIICVTCPQGMHWEVDNMDIGPFAEIPELSKIRDNWRYQGLKTVPMNIPPEKRTKLEMLQVKIVFLNPEFFKLVRCRTSIPLLLWQGGRCCRRHRRNRNRRVLPARKTRLYPRGIQDIPMPSIIARMESQA